MNADQGREPHKVRVTIFNQVYTLVTSGDPDDTEESARRVDELMMQISRGGNLDVTRVAVLAALHLADELRSAEKRLTVLKDITESRTRELALLLDDAVGE